MGLSVNWTQPRKEISEFEAMSVETSQTEKQRGKQKKKKKWNRISKIGGIIAKGSKYV